MKIKVTDPKTGEVLDDMERARRHYCYHSDVSCREGEGCPLYSPKETCKEFVARFPEGAAWIMGYELKTEI